MFEYDGGVSDSPLTTAHRLLVEAIDALSAATDAATDDELLSVLTLCEGTSRRLDRLTVATVATLERRGTFAERGYTSTPAALGDLLGWERFEARQRVVAAEQVCPQVGLDGTALPARLAATAEVFAAGATGLRHVAVIARVLASPAAERLSPQVWAGAEAQLADKAAVYTPSELQAWGTALVEALDEDGPEPDDRPPAPVNELHLVRHRGKAGGALKGRFDDAAMFDAIATVVDAHARPATGDEQRSTAQRQAEALADVCGYVLDHGDVPECGGRRPHLNVLVRLEDLENRARAACLDFGGTLSPESLRMLACDARVVPVVLNGKGQPLDVGRVTRTIPDGLRRAIAARDRGCAGCGRPPSWCEVHHIKAWQDGGDTALHNCVMLCRACHRLQHHSEWEVRIRDGLPELIPPAWIDPLRRPRRKPLLHLAA
ncbi:HNH endonuclease signature motif containing protein [Pseudonocardia xinjiangensis]